MVHFRFTYPDWRTEEMHAGFAILSSPTQVRTDVLQARRPNA